MEITIREAEARDRSRLIDLFQALNCQEDGVTGDRRTDRAAAEETLDFVQAQLVERGGRFFVAEAGGEVAGLLVLVFETDSIYVRPENRPFTFVRDLVVDERHRRFGIGRSLLEAAEKLAVAKGYRRLVLNVLAGNAAAEAAYVRYGFRPYAHDLQKLIG